MHKRLPAAHSQYFATQRTAEKTKGPQYQPRPASCGQSSPLILFNLENVPQVCFTFRQWKGFSPVFFTIHVNSKHDLPYCCNKAGNKRKNLLQAEDQFEVCKKTTTKNPINVVRIMWGKAVKCRKRLRHQAFLGLIKYNKETQESSHKNLIYPSFNFLKDYPLSVTGGLNLSQLSWVVRRGTPWRGHESIKERQPI